MDPLLLDQLKRHEGLRLTPYRDSVGKLTIGYGTNLDAGISEDEASFLLNVRVVKAAQDLATALPWTNKLDAVRQAVLINMAYNMGIGNGKRGLTSMKSFLALAQNGDYKGAAADGRATLWAKQVGPRATELMNQLETGQWQNV